MGLKIEPRSHPCNVNWVDKTAQSIIKCSQFPIHMSSHEDRVWCDVLYIDVAHILLGRPLLYDLDVINMGRSNSYELEFKEKKIVLKPVEPKSNVGNNREGTITDKNNKTRCYLVTRSHISPDYPIDGFTYRSRNSLGLLPLPLGISSIVTVEPPVPHLHELHDHNTR